MNMKSIREKIAWIRRALRRVGEFASEDVWDMELSSLPALRGMLVRGVRVVKLVFKGFKEDECSMHASALTFSTLMAIVPVLALCLSMARGLGDAETAKRWIQSRVENWTETFNVERVQATNTVVAADGAVKSEILREEGVESQLAARINSIVEKGFKKVEKINFARLGTTGLIILIWMVIEVLGRVESSFNRVWGVVIGRSVWRRFTDYLSVLLILPVLVVAAASMPVMDMLTRFLDDQSAQFIERLVASGFFKNLTVVGMTTLAFTFLIMFMPNAVIRFRPGVTGGFVAALLFLVWLALCAMIQVGAARYGKIYGSFAVVPILLAWVYVSWQIVLFGAEVAFAVQNCATYKMEQSAREANVLARITLAVSVVKEAARAMLKAEPPFRATAYAREKGVSVRFLNTVIEELVQAGYLGRLSETPGAFALLKSPSAVPVGDVVNVIMQSGAGPAELGLRDLSPDVAETVRRATGGIETSLGDTTVEALLVDA